MPFWIKTVQNSVLFLLGILFFFNLSQATTPPPLSITEMEQAVFLIKITTTKGVPLSQGTGFVITDSGRTYLVTAFHVVEGAPTIQSISATNKYGKSLNIKASMDHAASLPDLFIMDLDEYEGPTLTLAKFNSNSGHMMGFPKAEFKQIKIQDIKPSRRRDCSNVDESDAERGSFNNFKTSEEDFLTGMIEYPHSLFGSSGGPLFNETGEAIGMTINGEIGCYVLFIDSILIKRLLDCFQQPEKNPFCENVMIKRN